MPLMSIDGLDLNVRQWGSGEPLVLVHGLGTRSGLWFNQVPVLAQHFHVVAVDLRGFGRSQKPQDAAAYSIELMARDIRGVCRALGLDTINFLGVSMGGFIGQQLALDYPDLCTRLVLGQTACEFAIPPDVMTARLEALDQTSMDAYAELVAAQALAQPCDPLIEEWLREMIADNDRTAYKHTLAGALAAFDLSAHISTIKSPTLVIAGSDDRVLPPEGGRKIAELIPDAQFELIEGVGHLGYVEKPDVFNRAVMSFLNQPVN